MSTVTDSSYSTSNIEQNATSFTNDNNKRGNYNNQQNPPTKTQQKKIIFLTVVSMNVAQCDPSADAPTFWTSNDVTRAIQQELLQQDPDILALQECPSREWVTATFEHYHVIGIQAPHAGNVALLVKKNNKNHTYQATRISTDAYGLPAVVAAIELPTNPQENHLAADNTTTTILVASCHLAPFRGGNYNRQAQMESLLQLGGPTRRPLIVAGDTNMRPDEDVVMENELGFMDAWKLAGADPATQYTWDTRNHLQSNSSGDTNKSVVAGWVKNSWRQVAGANYPTNKRNVPNDDNTSKSNRGTFNRFYGASTREYAARYDRTYISLPSNNNEKGTPEKN